MQDRAASRLIADRLCLRASLERTRRRKRRTELGRQVVGLRHRGSARHTDNLYGIARVDVNLTAQTYRARLQPFGATPGEGAPECSVCALDVVAGVVAVTGSRSSPTPGPPGSLAPVRVSPGQSVVGRAAAGASGRRTTVEAQGRKARSPQAVRSNGTRVPRPASGREIGQRSPSPEARSGIQQYAEPLLCAPGSAAREWPSESSGKSEPVQR